MQNQDVIDEIRARYDEDSRIPHPAEVAVAERAGTVTLRGTVASFHERRAAVDLARSVHGVRDVSDEIVVDPRDRWQDDEIRGAALQALMASIDVPAHFIDVHVDAGWLTLRGEVKHQSESDAAFAAVSRVPGVAGITNRIVVITGGGH